MIIGIGTDIIQIPRIEKLIKKYPEEFLYRILSESEIEKYFLLNEEFRANFVAKRYAAKEAIAKAFGTGIGSEIGFQDITIENDPKGRPIAKISSQIAANKKIDLSISDDHPIAVAFVVVSQ